MNLTSLRSVTLAAAVLIGSVASLWAGEPASVDAGLAAKLITAIENSDHAAFIADGEAPFQKLTKAQFEAVAAQLGPRLKQGHELSYLGELKQRGYRVTLWKISFKDGSDDALATLSVRADKVGGFWIR